MEPHKVAGLGPTIITITGLMAYTAWSQAYWWSSVQENWFGWLTPLFVLFVISARKSQIKSSWTVCKSAEGNRSHLTWDLMAWFVLCFGLGLFLIGATFRAAVGPTIKGSFVISAALALVVPSLIWINAGAGAPSCRNCPIWADSRVELCTQFIFPTAIWLLSAPLVSAFASQLTLILIRPIINTVSLVFNVCGLPIVQQGNILIMPDQGRVGVEEACSGIRSLTACLFAGSFLSAVYLSRFWLKFGLVLSAALLAFGLNVLRSLFLTAWAYRRGASSIEGGVHDITGYIVMLFTTCGLIGLLSIFNRHFSRDRIDGATR